MINFKNYVPEILDISEAHSGCEMHIATDMLINNIQDHGRKDDQYVYPGAEHLDYEALQAEWSTMTQTEQEKAKNDFLDWCDVNEKKIRDAVLAAREVGLRVAAM